MVYKRYIKRGGKTFGPYYYESYRDNHGKVRTRFVSGPGSVTQKKSNRGVFLIAVFLAIILAGVFFVSYSSEENFVQRFVSENDRFLNLGDRINSLITGFASEGSDDSDGSDDSEGSNSDDSDDGGDQSSEDSGGDESDEDSTESSEDADESESIEEESSFSGEEEEDLSEELEDASSNEGDGETLEEETLGESSGDELSNQTSEDSGSDSSETTSNETTTENNETEVPEIDLNESEQDTEGNQSESNQAILPETNSSEEGRVERGITGNFSVNQTTSNSTVAEFETNITLSNESIIDNSTAVNSSIRKRVKIVINRPVKWIEVVKLNETNSSEKKIKIPKISENITIKTGGEIDAVLEEIDRETEEIESAEKVDLLDGSITGRVSFESEGRGVLTRFLEWVGRLRITGQVISDGELEEEIIETEDAKEVDLSGLEEDEVAIEYYTDAPTASEEEIDGGKKVVISGPEEVEYTDVLAYSELPESFGVTSKEMMRLYWETEGENADFDVYDLNENGIYDYIEWVVPHLSNQTYLILIEITSAEHLDSSREFISDIYAEVSALDGNWSEVIPAGDYVRVVFEENLTSERDVTVFPRTVSGTPRIEVYEVNGSEIVASFESLVDDELNTVYLDGSSGAGLGDREQDVFDLLILDGDVEFDWIVDPDTGLHFPTVFGDPVDEWSSSSNLGASDDSDATETTIGHVSDTSRYTFGIPAGSTIDGIEARAEGDATTGARSGTADLGITLSWDGGASYTTQKTNTFTAGAGDVQVVYGGSTDTWGRTWSVDEFNNTNFRARVNMSAASSRTNFAPGIDAVAVRVYYTEAPAVTSLTSCGMLNNSGVYVLANDVNSSGTCFIINGSHINFDGQGFTINDTSIGISADNQANITVKNFSMTYVNTGVRFEGVNDSSILNTTISVTTEISGDEGIYLEDASGILVENNSIFDALNEEGIDIIGTTNSSFLDNYLERHGVGFRLTSSENNTFERNTVFNLSNFGFFVSSSNYNSFADDLINLTGSHGISISGSDGNNFTNVTFLQINSASYDISLGSGSDGNRFIDMPHVGNYSLSTSGVTLSVIDSTFGEIKFLEAVNGSGTNFTDDVRIGNNSAIVESTSNIGLNRSANVTLYGIGERGFSIPGILRDDANCGSLCHNFTALNASTVVLNVTSWTNYSIGDAPQIPYTFLNSPDNASEFLIAVLNITLNASVSDPNDDTIDVLVFGGNESAIDYANGLLYQAFNVSSGTEVTYNWTGPLTPIDSDSVLLWHLDNRSEYGENDTYVIDSSGNGLNGTAINGSFVNVSGKFGGAFEFDGVNDYINHGSDGGINTYPLSFSAWVYTKGSTDGAIVEIYDDASFNKFYGIGVNASGSAKIYAMELGSNKEKDGGPSLNDGWHHIVGVFLGASDRRLYVDGVNVANDTDGLIFTSQTNSIEVGRGQLSQADFFNGTIDEVAVWERALNDSEVLDLYRLKAGTYYWKVNVTDTDANSNESETREFEILAEDANSPTITLNSPANESVFFADIFNITLNSTVYDPNNDTIDVLVFGGNESAIDYANGLLYQAFNVSSGTEVTYNWTAPTIIPDSDNRLVFHFDNRSVYGENSTYVRDFGTNARNGTLRFGAFINLSGKFGWAVQFDGINDDIRIPSHSSLSFDDQGNYTWSAWVRPGIDAGSLTLFNNGDQYSGDGIWIYIDGSEKLVFYDNGGGSPTSTTSVPAGVWTHVAAVYQAGSVSLYVNGNEDVSGESLGGTIFDNTDHNYLGIETGDQEHYFNGSIDEFGYWERALSTSEIKDLYRLTVGTFYWKVNATDSNGDSGESETRDFDVIDGSAPTITSLTETPSDPATYSFGGTYEFNATVTDNYELDTVTIEFNGTDYSPTNLSSNVYNFSISNLAAGTYNYVWSANDSSNNLASTSTQSYTINRATPAGSLTNTDPWTITYPEEVTIGYSESNQGDGDLTYLIYRDGENVGSGETVTLGAGSYSYLLNTTGGQNYSSTASLDSETLTVGQGTSVINLTLNGTAGNITLDEDANILLNGTLVTGDASATLRLYNNGTLINEGSLEVSNTTLFSVPGLYNITAIYVSSQNYSLSSLTYWVQANDITPPLVTINFPVEDGEYAPSDLPLNFNVSLNELGNVLYSLNDGVNNVTMLDGMNVVGQNFNATNGSLADGLYTFQVYANDSAGNRNHSESNQFRFDSTGPVISNAEINATSSVLLDTIVKVNASISDAGVTVGDVLLQIDPPISASYNVSAQTSGSEYFNDSVALNEVGQWVFTFFANDSLGNNALPVIAQDEANNNYIEVVEYQIGLDLLYPFGNVNVTRNAFFNVTLNVSCSIGNCGALNVSLEVSENQTAPFELVNRSVGTIPFYTNSSSQPVNLTLATGESELVIYFVNATGNANTNHTFFAYANLTAFPSVSNTTEQWNVTLTNAAQAISISLSAKLAQQINWTFDFLPVFNRSAEGNNQDSTNLTEYWVNVSTDGGLADLYMRANSDLATVDLDILGIGNETFSVNQTNASVPDIQKFQLTTDFADNKIGSNLPDKSSVYLKFFINAPIGQPAGTYNNSLEFTAVGAGLPP